MYNYDITLNIINWSQEKSEVQLLPIDIQVM